MRSLFFAFSSLLPLLAAAQDSTPQNFTISNGQIFTPGLAILNSPQPNTPMGGETLHISLDVTTNGQMPLPPYDPESPTHIFNITVFLSSYETGRNFTITNGTATENNATLGDIMLQQPSSTVKHLDWVWPDCLVGDGAPDSSDSDRGIYNISIRQNFRLNGEDHYTIFDLPIRVTNSIEEDDDRPDCDALDNPLLAPEEIDVEGANAIGVLFAPGDSTEIEVIAGSDGEGGEDREDGEDGFGQRPEAGPEDGLGSGAGALSWWGGVNWLCISTVVYSLVL